MATTIRALILEDSEDDAYLLVRELEKAGFEVDHHRVCSPEATLQALQDSHWDVVLSDYVMPQFSALDALGILKDLGLDIPFIVVSGAISEETAVAAMRAGAHDYLMKGNLARLGEALRRSLADAQARSRAAQAEREKEAAHRRLEHINQVLKAIRNVNQLIVSEKDPQVLAEQTCRMLIETRGYNGAWIMTGDLDSPPHTAAQAGLGSVFDDSYNPPEGGRWPLCRDKVLSSETDLVILDPKVDCQGCPVAEVYGDFPTAVAPLTHGGKVLGLLGISFPTDQGVDQEERSLLVEVAGDLAFALHDIQMEHAGRERERQFRALFHHMSQGVVYLDRNAVVLQVNPASEKILGLKESEMVGRNARDPIWGSVREDGSPYPGEDLPAVRALETGRPNHTIMGIHNAAQDRRRWIKVHAEPEIREGEKDPFRVFLTFEDITELRDAHRRLKASEQLLEATGRMARVGGWELDARSQKVSWTRITREIHEVPDDFEPTLEDAVGFFHPEDRPRLEAAIDAALQEGKPYDMEVRFISAKGRELWTHTRCRPVEEAGEVVRLLGTFQDISLRKEALKEMAASERRFRRLFQNNLAPMVITDDHGQYLDVNPAACQLFGYERAEFLKMSVSDLKAATPTASSDQFEDYRASGARTGEFSFVRPDGDRRIVAWSAAEIDDGTHASVLRDITDLTLKEQEVRAEKEKAQQFLDVAATMLLGLDTEGRITLLNRTGREVLGLGREEEVLGSDWFQFVSEEDREAMRVVFQSLLGGEEESHRRVEGKVRSRDGRIRWMVWHNALVRDEEGAIVGTLSSGEDVTDRREMESQLAQADRLSSMGMLAAGVAHEINNPLTYVLYNLESLTADLPGLLAGLRECRARFERHLPVGSLESLPEEAASAMNTAFLSDMNDRFEEALAGTQRIREIVRSLSTFARVERAEAVPVDLKNVIDVALNMGFNEIKYRARLVKDFGPVPPVMASEGRLAQVFLNLVINAAHAIDEGDVENNEIRLRTWGEDGRALAEVRDTGCGIPQRNLQKLFDPFFTTKKIGVGSGLGLAISRSIVEGYGGTISVESEVGKGTRFVVSLPVMEAEVEEQQTDSFPEESPRIPGRLLIVDDEDAVRSSLARVLKEHEIVEARNGAEAKEILAEDQSFDLILCDMMMSEVSGMDLHQWLTDHHPTLGKQFIFMTGGAFTPKSREYLAKVDNIRLEKPFEVANIRNLVSELVRSGKEGQA